MLVHFIPAHVGRTMQYLAAEERNLIEQIARHAERGTSAKIATTLAERISAEHNTRTKRMQQGAERSIYTNNNIPNSSAVAVFEKTPPRWCSGGGGAGLRSARSWRACCSHSVCFIVRECIFARHNGGRKE